MSNETPPSSSDNPAKPVDTPDEPLYGEAAYENPGAAADLDEQTSPPTNGDARAADESATREPDAREPATDEPATREPDADRSARNDAGEPRGEGDARNEGDDAPVVTEHPVSAEASSAQPDTAQAGSAQPDTAQAGSALNGTDTGRTDTADADRTDTGQTQAQRDDGTGEHPVADAYAEPVPAERTWAPDPSLAYTQAGPMYVAAPTKPKVRSNRGGGTLIAILSAVLFGIVYLLVVAAIGAINAGDFTDSLLNFLVSPVFYIPVIFFAVALIVLVLIVNRASWWVYIIGSFFVGAVTYFAFFGGALLSEHAWDMTPGQAGDFMRTLWVNPFAFIAGILGNEVAIWMSGWLAARGRRLKAKNAEAKTEYDRQVAAGPQQARY